jgi:methyl-accepting chemotaxis protein
MRQLRGYFDRIQGRLVAVFGFGLVGAVAIWAVGVLSLNAFADRVAERMDELHRRTELVLGLEAAIVDQFAAGQAYLETRDTVWIEEFEAQDAQTDSLLARFEASRELSDTEQGQVARLRSLHRLVASEHRTAQREVAADPGAARARLTALEPRLRELRGINRALNLAEVRRVEQTALAISQAAQDRQRFLAILLIATALIGGVFAYLTMRAVETPLQRLVLAANQFGDGDLKVSINGRMPDEFQVLAGAFTGMADRIRTVVGETVSTANTIGASASDLSSISEEVAASSGEVSTAMVGISMGAEEQAMGLRNVDEALDNMRNRAAEIDEAADRVRELSGQIRELAELRRQDVGRAVSMLLEVREVVERSGREVNALQRASEKVTDFVETIQGIARQTNLLALNAAIEAARAGDQGRGFAVVADEVRKLADGSAHAADEVATTVRGIREQIATVVDIMARGAEQVSGVETTSKGAETAFEEIIDAVGRVRDAAQRVALAADENRKAVALVEENVRAVGATAESHAASAEQVSAAAEQQSAATEQMSAASLELLQAADRLKQIVSGFRI